MTRPASGPSDPSLPLAPARPGRFERDDIELVLEALVNAGTSMWVWNLKTDALIGGAGAQQLLGYPPDADFHSQARWNELIHPADLPAFDRAFEAYLAGSVTHFEQAYRARAADGGWRWLQERGRIVEWDAEGQPLRMVGILTDITERKRAELRQLEQSARLEEVARNLPGMLFQMVTHGAEKRFSYASQRSLDLLGVPAERLLADVHAFEDLRQLDDQARADLARIDPRSGPGLWVTEYPILRPDGLQRWLRVTSSSELHTDGSVLWHGYMEDVTERRAHEDTRQQAAEAVAANAAKTRFLSRMSHELRTPLNAVLGFAQLMEMDTADPLSPAHRRRVGMVRDAGEHLLRMIGDLLDLTRIESGQLQVTPVPVEVLPLVRDCVALMGPQAQAAQVRLDAREHAPAGAPPARALADPTRLRQILLNLLSNAVKYNRPGGQVMVGVAVSGDWLRLSVLDTGVGIAEADQPLLFEPFNRLGASRSGIEGTGIGLAVTRALAEVMGGRVEVRSQAGSGSEFSVLLPRPATDRIDRAGRTAPPS